MSLVKNALRDDAPYASLLRKYSKAPYSYLTITDFEGHQRRFLANSKQNPKFTYITGFSELKLKERLGRLEADLKQDGLDEPSRKFLNRRISETQLLLALLNNDLDKVRKLNAMHFGEPSLALTEHIIGHGMKFITLNYPEMLMSPIFKDLERLVNFELKPGTKQLLEVAEADFEHYQKLLSKNQAPLLAVLARKASGPFKSAAVVKVIDEGLKAIGADKLGWKVVPHSHLSYVRIDNSTKTVVVGKGIFLKDHKSLKQIVLHELGVHVMRSVNGEESRDTSLRYGSDGSRSSEEGLAIFVEQLSRQKLIPLRTFRYLAAALASGVDGKQRDFKMVFEVLWRYIYLISSRNETNARKRAFHETARVFRGLPANAKGLSFNKDITYLVSNVKIWEHLRARNLSQSEFDAMFEGKVDVLNLLEGHQS